MNYKIDNLQYCNWSREVFQINREAELDAVHVTVVYHEDYDEFLDRVKEFFSDNNSFWIIYISFNFTNNINYKNCCQTCN